MGGNAKLTYWFQTALTSCDHGDLLVGGQLGLGLFVLADGELAPSVVDEESGGAADVDAVADLHVVQILRHLAAVRKLGVDVLEVHLDHQVHVACKKRCIVI